MSTLVAIRDSGGDAEASSTMAALYFSTAVSGRCLVAQGANSSHLSVCLIPISSVAHYASCSGTNAIHVVWSESDEPSDKLEARLHKIVLKKSQTAHKLNFKFDLNKEDNLNNRFTPIKGSTTDVVFSVDDDVIVPCPTLDFAFTVWHSAPFTMVGFVPRMHRLNEEYLDMYKYEMPSSIHDYVARERNCIMSLLNANATEAPPIWVKV